MYANICLWYLLKFLDLFRHLVNVLVTVLPHCSHLHTPLTRNRSFIPDTFPDFTVQPWSKNLEVACRLALFSCMHTSRRYGSLIA